MNECGSSCPYKQAILELQKDAEKNTKTHKEFFQRFESQAQAQVLTNERYNTILRNLEDLKATVEPIVNKGNQNWSTLVNAIIVAFGSGIVGLLIGLITTGGIHG